MTAESISDLALSPGGVHTLLKSIVVHQIPINNVAAMERWYYQRHAPEICRRYGPWLHRHESYLPVDAPAEAREYGFYNWRVTEGWWREIPKGGPQGELAFTVPPVYPQVSVCFVPWQPDDDYMGSDVQPDERNVLRWYILFKYPEGVDKEEGDRWFQERFAPEIQKQPKLFRFFSYKTVKQPGGLPGTWPAGKNPPPETLNVGWDRLIELWYEDFDGWRDSVINNPPAYTRPDWATRDSFPFVELGQDFVSSFLLERPSDEFLRDSRFYL